jgi:restriction system protein
MTSYEDPIRITPEDFERQVRCRLEAAGAELEAFKVTHREKLAGSDGVYEIDVTARFSALGANFVVLVECKHQASPIKRDVVQVLHARVQSLGAHKGMLFATSTFQKGAVEYAKEHGIALVRVTYWSDSFVTFSQQRQTVSCDEAGYACWLVDMSERGGQLLTWLSADDAGPLNSLLRKQYDGEAE